MSENFKFFANTACEYFPCHDTEKPEDFNCLFCYCPLYFYEPGCGGGFVTLKSGLKDCSGCKIPHSRGGWDHINRILSQYFERFKPPAHNDK